MKSRIFRFSNGKPKLVGFAATIEDAQVLLGEKAAYGQVKSHGLAFYPSAEKAAADAWNRPIVTPQIL